MVLLTWLLLTAAPVGEPATAAHWIWYPENPAVEGERQTRYLRRVVTLAAPSRSARLRLRWDDGAKFEVNGQPAPAPLSSDRAGSIYDLTKVLVAGQNVLSFAVYNATGMGGLIVNGTIVQADGTVLRLFSDAAWRASRVAPEGWQRPGFDDHAWPAAGLVGSVFAPPWFGHPSFDMEPFLEPGEREQFAAWRASCVALPPGLAAEPPTTARFARLNGQTSLVLNGQPRPPLIYRGTVDPLTAHGRRQIALFRDAGVHVYCAYVMLSGCEPQPGRDDFAHLDDVVRGYLSADPEARVILILHLIPPDWWFRAHPGEMVGYATGPAGAGEDESGRALRPSLASEAWRQDMGRLWTRAIAHLEQQPWGRRVIGYHPGYGIYTEWHYYGSWTQQAPDTGPAMTAWFRGWLRRKYATDAALQASWAQPAVTLATATVPGVPPRLAGDALGLRDPGQRGWVIDYYQAQQQLTGQRVTEFCALADQATGGRVLTGAFYGYFEGVLPQTQGGHLELGKLLDTSKMSYFAAPYDYSHRLMGDDGRSRAIIDAFALAGKVHMIEADTRTHLHPVDEYGRQPDVAGSLAAIRREVATSLIHRTALWWCDFGANGGGGWYDDPALSGEVRRLYDFADRRRAKESRPVAEIALIADLPSCYHVAEGGALRTQYALIDQVTGELNRTGAPFDFILLSQLPRADLGRYKLLVFLNALRVEPALRPAVRQAAAGRSCVWLWAPGITDGQRFGPDLVRDLTGFGATLAGQGVPAESAVVDGTDVLTTGLPASRRYDLQVRGRQPLPAAGVAANWYNPRDKRTMDDTYTAFRVTPAAGGIDWEVGTTAGWSDVHLKAAVAVADGLSLTVAGSGAVDGLSWRVAIKDADGAEFVSPLRPAAAQPVRHDLPLAAFDKAPWDRSPSRRPRFPLTGLKVILYGLDGGRRGTLHLRDVAALTGEVTVHEQRTWPGLGAALPCLTLDEPAGNVLARRAETGEARVAVHGQPGRRQLFSALASLPQPVLDALVTEAGVHRYVTEPGVLVQADSTLLVLHTAAGGRCTVHLPRAERLTDALSGQVVGQGRDIPLTLPRSATWLLERTAGE